MAAGRKSALTKWLRGLFSDTRGQEMVEYAVFIGLVRWWPRSPYRRWWNALLPF